LFGPAQIASRFRCDPDLGLAVDRVAHEDAHASERAAVTPLLAGAKPGALWIAAKSRSDLHGTGISAPARSWEAGGKPGPASPCGRTETGQVRGQAITAKGQQASWRRIGRRIGLALDAPAEAGETTIRLWSNLPAAVGANRIAELYRTRWRVEGSRSPAIEGMFGRLESVLHSEVTSLGHPRAALPGFAAAVLAYDILALLARCVGQAHHRRSRHQTCPPITWPCRSEAATRAC